MYLKFLIRGIFPRICFNHKTSLFAVLLSTLAVPFLSSSPASATCSASLSTDSSITLNIQNGNTTIVSSGVRVVTDCHNGYNLTLAGSVADNNLYRNGVSSNNSGSYFSPSDGVTTLINSSNTWGYSLSVPSLSNPSIFVAPTEDDVFHPVPASNDTPAVLKNALETASESNIDDSFNVYYGAYAATSLASGEYTMTEDGNTNNPGVLTYYLTVEPELDDFLEITFVDNATGDTVTNLPTSIENILDTNNGTLTLSNKTPARSGYIFREWNTNSNGTGNAYQPGTAIVIGNNTSAGELAGEVNLYAIWVAECASATICYDGNGATAGTMSNQTGKASSTVALIASNYSRTGYAFTGWNTSPDGSGTQYGPNQNFTMPSSGGVNLFAQWLAPSGTLQDFSSTNAASNMNTGDVLALEDNRDGEVYMVAKLADGNIWITENLRLLPNTAIINNSNTNHPTVNFISGAPSSFSSTGQCSDDNKYCVDRINYNAHNLNRNLTPVYNGNTNDTYWYSYGVMYNWYTATAGNGTYELTESSAAGDLCPAGWHLPTGGSNGEWGILANSMPGNNGVARSASLRRYPNNFLYSGDYNPQKDIPDGVGTQGRLWSATPVSSDIKNSYRMGYNSNDITAAIADANSWNKWDNFAIRCIYQGGNVPYNDVEINFVGTGITKLTFTSQNQGIEIATPENPTISLARNITYDVTATLTNNYEIASWVTASGGTLGNSTTTNPAPSTNTYTVATNTTLTITSQLIPTYTVTATLGEHVTGINFVNNNYGTETITPASSSCIANQDNTYTCTIDLKRSVEYTISGTYESGYGFDTWTTGAGGTLGNATSRVTTYIISGATTLSLTATEAEDKTYTLIYHAGSGTDAPETESIISQDFTESFTITNSTPIYYGYTFTGWSETADSNNNGTTIDYVSGDTITIDGTNTTNTKTLYPVYQTVAACPAGNICYYDNGADVNGGGRGTMANQSNNTSKLIPPNYSRAGYGFAGWTTAENATPYGPNATITTPDISSTGLTLYAKWVKSEGDLQSWRGCDTMTTNQVIALTDTRDNNTYAVAKLADDKCWTIENLRLDPGLATITAQNTHNPTSGFITESTTDDGSGNPVSLSTDILCSTDDDANCINSIQYNTSSINRSLTPNKSASSSSWYSYGIYYNWYTATAGHGVMDTAKNVNVSGDICPRNWHLPTSTNSGEWATLNRVVNGGVSNADAGLRTYPVNLIWSGDYSTGRTSGYNNGRYWSSTGYDASNAYRMGHQESGSKGASPNGNYRKWDGFAVRCVRNEDTIEYSNLTVTLPQNVESITFTHPQYSTETVSSQNSVVSLVQDTSYTMTATFSSGYELGAWTGDANITITDSTANPTTIVITDDSILTLTANEIPTSPNTLSAPSQEETASPQPQSQIENINNSTNDNTDSSYAKPQGVSISTDNEQVSENDKNTLYVASNGNQNSSLGTTLLVIAATTAAIGIGCIVYAERDKDDE